MCKNKTKKNHLKFALDLKGQKPSDFFPTRTDICATQCSICSLPLTKAESISHMIGPICREKYILTNFSLPTDKKKALEEFWGYIAVANLDEDLNNYLFSNENDFAMMADILIAYCSIVTLEEDGHAKILIVSSALRCLGYELVADKLEEDRCKIKLYPSKRMGKEDTHFMMMMPLKGVDLTVSEMEKYIGKENIEYFQPNRTRRGCYWEFPKSLANEWLYSLSLLYGGERFFQKGEETIQKIPRRSTLGKLPPCASWLKSHDPAVKIEVHGKKILVWSPAPWITKESGIFKNYVKSLKTGFGSNWSIQADSKHLNDIKTKALSMWESWDVRVEVVTPIPTLTTTPQVNATNTKVLVTFTTEGSKIRMKSPVPWSSDEAGELVAAVKSTKGRKYDRKTYTWLFPLKHWATIEAKVKACFPNQWALDQSLIYRP